MGPEIYDIFSNVPLVGAKNMGMLLYPPRERHLQLRILITLRFRLLGLASQLNYWPEKTGDVGDFSGLGEGSLKTISEPPNFLVLIHGIFGYPELGEGFEVRFSSRPLEKSRKTRNCLEAFPFHDVPGFLYIFSG
jgi:hypothetical protein